MQKKAFSFAVGALLLSARAVSAATVTDNLNVRSGPGISFNVIGAMPAGSDVRVLNCGRSCCRVAWNAEDSFPAVGRFTRLRRRPALSHLGPPTAATGTVMLRPKIPPGLQTQAWVSAADGGIPLLSLTRLRPRRHDEMAARISCGRPLPVAPCSLIGVRPGVATEKPKIATRTIRFGGRGEIRTHEGARAPCRFSRPVP